jgi:hypothetical protein
MYQPRAYMQMLKREGRFRILKSSLTKDIRLWHNCEEYKDQDLQKHRTIYEVHYGDYKNYPVDPEACMWQCTMCGAEAPEGLAGVYIMLDWDRATDEIAVASEPDPWADSMNVPF